MAKGDYVLSDLLKLKLIKGNQVVQVSDLTENFEIIDKSIKDVINNTANKQEVQSVFNETFIYDTLKLAQISDVTNLFTDTRLEGSAKFDLSKLSKDESEIVNIRLLSLFNDLLQQRMNSDLNSLEKRLNSSFNSQLETFKNNTASISEIKQIF